MDAGKVYGITANKSMSTPFNSATDKGLVDWAASMIKKGHGPVYVVTTLGKYEHRSPPVDYVSYSESPSAPIECAGQFETLGDVLGIPKAAPNGNIDF